MQRLDQGISGGIDRGGISQWLLSLFFDLWMSEFSSCPIPFGEITVVATEHKVADAVRAPTTTRYLVIKLEHRIFASAIDAPMMILLQDIGSDLPPKKFSALVVNACYLWILHQSKIELDPFHFNAADGHPTSIAPSPREHVANP